jgi:nitrate/nitrite transport system substrate-binding protein
MNKTSEMTRREILRRLMLAGAGAVSGQLLTGCGNNTPAESSSANSQTTGEVATNNSGASGPIRIGYIKLTDCASVIMAQELGLFKKHGVTVELKQQPSWPITRDNLASGQIEAAHCLFGMPFAVETGVSDSKGDPLRIAMLLNNNGQATTLSSKAFPNVGYADYAGFKKAVETLRKTKEPTFAMTFPGGTHDMWIHLTLAAAGIDPRSVKIKPIPPPQMVANMEAGNMDGYNVGEPWGGVAAKKGIGFTFLATQTLWKHHPEKALVVNGKFAETRRNDLKKVMMAILEASQWLDAMKNRAQAAKTIGGQQYINAPADVIDARLMGDYFLGEKLGKKMFKDDTMLFHRNGETNFPRYAHGVWFMTNYVRFGRLKTEPNYEEVAKKVILQDLYKEVAQEMKIPIPSDDMKPFFVQADGGNFDPGKPDVALKYYAGLMKTKGGMG